MIPLLSIGKIIASILSIYVAFYGYRSWKTNQDKISEYTFKFFLYLIFVFGLFAPLPFIKDLFIIQLIFYLIELVSLIAIIYLFLIFLESMGWSRFNKLVYLLILCLAFVLLISYSFNFNEAKEYTFDFLNIQFVGWAAELPIYLRIMSFGLIAAFTFFCSILLLNKIYKIENIAVKNRGFWFILGFISMGISGSAYFIYGSIQPTSFFKDLIHVISSLAVPLCFLKVIIYKKSK